MPAAERSAGKTPPAGAAGECRRARSCRCRARSRRPSTLAALRGLDRRAASLVFVVSSPSVRTTSTFVSVGACRSSLAGLDHGVVERRALHGVERDLAAATTSSASMSAVERRARGFASCPNVYMATSSRPGAWPSRTRRRPACAASSGAPFIERLTSIATPIAAAGAPPPDLRRGDGRAVLGDREAAPAGRSSLPGGDHDRGDERIARRVDLRDPEARRGRGRRADRDREHGREAGDEDERPPHADALPNAVGRTAAGSRASGSSWKNCGGRCTPFSPSLERNCGLMPLRCIGAEQAAGRARRGLLAVLDGLGDEEILQRHDVRLHAQHLGDVRDAARAVDEARDLDDHVEGRGDLLADGLERQLDAAGQDERLDARERVARACSRGSS